MNELGVIAARTARPAVKASALAVASGSLVASFAVPASAAPVAAAALAGAPVAAPAVPAPAAAPVAIVPAAVPLVSAQAVSAAAVVAPKTGAVSSAISQGVLGFTAKKATAAATMTVERIQVEAPVAQRASRSAVRTSTGSRSTGSGSTGSGSTTSSPRNDAPAPAPTGGIIGIAASLTGIPYVYGGTSRGGFDCSGYTQYVYRQAGRSIPRTAEAQRSASARVSNPVPGDLIFFGFPAYHAGIYAGGGKLYHASRPGTVTSLASIWTYSSVSYGRF
jgi:cell wall-associated NlpC family hydrolase